jgi:hypothetical protein
MTVCAIASRVANARNKVWQQVEGEVTVMQEHVVEIDLSGFFNGERTWNSIIP